MDNTEVLMFDSVDARNAVFDGLRRTGTPLEQQVVKFSDVRLADTLDAKHRLQYVSTWALAYPRS